jgi:hypothetical protein
VPKYHQSGPPRRGIGELSGPSSKASAFTLENTGTELAADIVDQGYCPDWRRRAISLDEHLRETGLPVSIAEDPFLCGNRHWPRHGDPIYRGVLMTA